MQMRMVITKLSFNYSFYPLGVFEYAAEFFG